MKEKIAPIFIVMIIVVLIILYAGTVLIILFGMGPLMTAVGIIFAVGGTAASIALLVTLKKRLKEIKEDKDNDYSKY
jgi:membrane associated rhomboid family serine protease